MTSEKLGVYVATESQMREQSTLRARLERAQGKARDLSEQLAETREKLEAARNVLRDAEWCEDYHFDEPVCVSCHEDKKDGHAPDCKLAALLEE